MDEISGLDGLVEDNKVGGFDKYKTLIASVRQELNAGDLSIATIENMKSLCGSLGDMGRNTAEAVDMYKDVMGLLDKKAEELKLSATQENPTMSSDEAVALTLRSDLVQEGVEDLHKLTDEKMENLGIKEDKSFAEDYVDTVIVDKNIEEVMENELKESSNEEKTEDSKLVENKEEDKETDKSSKEVGNEPKEKSSEELIVENMIKSGEFSETAQARLLGIAVGVEADRKAGKLEGSSADAIVDRVIATEKGVFSRHEQAYILNYAVEAEKNELGKDKEVKPEKRFTYDESRMKRLEMLKPLIPEDTWAAFDIKREEDGKFSIRVPNEPHHMKTITQAIKSIQTVEKQIQMSMMNQKQRA